MSFCICVVFIGRLIKLIWSIAGQNIFSLEDIYRESRWNQGDAVWLPKEKDPCQNLTLSNRLMEMCRIIEVD